MSLPLKMGVPTTKDERWRYTNLHPFFLRNQNISLYTGGARQNVTVSEGTLPVDGIKLVLVNGFLSPELSNLDTLPDGLHIYSLQDALQLDVDSLERVMAVGDSIPQNGMRAVNDAICANGVLIKCDPHARIVPPVYLISIVDHEDAASQFFASRILIDMGKDAEMTFIESYHSSGPSCAKFNNILMQVNIGEYAKLSHVKWQREVESTVHVATVNIDLVESSLYEGFVVHLGGQVARHDTYAALKGKRAHASVNGIYICDGGRTHDISTVVHHVEPLTTGTQMVRGILSNKSYGVFLGKCIIDRDAQKVESSQLHNTLFLDQTSVVNSKPELEIYADDVKCSHGNTVGKIDQNLLFYLRSRGLPLKEARKFLIKGFLQELVHKSVPEKLQPITEAQLGKLVW